jgi:hypothetical protein
MAAHVNIHCVLEHANLWFRFVSSTILKQIYYYIWAHGKETTFKNTARPTYFLSHNIL